MTKILLYLLLAFVPINILGQDVLSIKGFDGPGNNQVHKSTIDSQNNIYIIGSFTGTINVKGTNYSTFGTGIDAFVSKYDSEGNLVWFRQIGSSNQTDYTVGLALSQDETSISVVGYYLGSQCDFGNGVVLPNFSTGSPDAFILNLKTSDGSINNVKRFAYGDGGQVATDLCIDKSSNIIIIGYVGGEGVTSVFDSKNSIVCVGPRNYFILQLNSNLEVNWLKNYTADDVNNNFFSIDFDDTGYYIAGMNKGNLNLNIATLTSQGPAQDMFLYKTDFNGNGQWVRSIKGSGVDASRYATCDQNGYIYLSGHYTSTDLKVDSTSTLQSKRSIPNKGLGDIFYAKYNTNGTLQWFNVAGSNGEDRLTRLSAYDHYFIIAGQYGGQMTFNNENINPISGIDALGVVHDENDNLLYAITAGGTSTDVNQTCVIDNQGNYVFIGEFTSPTISFDATHSLSNSNSGTKDMFIAKYKSRSITLISSPVLCHGSATGSISANPKGAWVGNKTYLWTKKGDPTYTSSTSIIENLSSGTYYCKISDNLHFEIDSATLVDPAELTVSQSSQADAKCYGSLDGKLEALASGGTGSISYLWSGTGAGIVATDVSQNTLAAGTYSLTVTDDNGCTKSLDNMVIAQPDKITFKNTDVSPINGSSGSVDLRIQGGTIPYLYNWTGPSGYTKNTQDITGLTIAGNYSVTVTDQNQCTRDTIVLIVDSHNLYASISQKTHLLCKGGNNGSITINVVTDNTTPNFIYSWTGPSGFTASTTAINNLYAGLYSFTVTDTNPEPDETYTISDIEIKEPANALDATLIKGDQTCYGLANGFVDTNPAGGTLPYKYSWKKDGNTLPNITEVLTNLSFGSFEVMVTDTNNCTVTKTISVVEPSLITLDKNITSVSCTESKNDGAIDVTTAGGTGPYTYHWSNGLATEDISLLSAGTYKCSVTDANACSVSPNFSVEQPEFMTASFNNTNVSCYGGENGTINLSISGGNNGSYSYLWDNGETNNLLTGLKSGRYFVNITDSKNCKKDFSTIISQPTKVSVSTSSIHHVGCYGASDGSISLSASGGLTPYIWVWKDGNTGSNVSDLKAGSYIYTVYDKNSCTESDTIDIVEPSELILSELPDAHVNIKCNGDSTGELEVVAIGSSGSYQYSIDGNTWQYLGRFANLPAGIHPVAVRDENSITCTKSSDITISQPEALAFTSNSATNITCPNLNDGKINALATGGTAPLSYVLKLNGTTVDNISGAATGAFEGLSAAEGYIVEVNDANLCGSMATSQMNIINPDSIEITEEQVFKTSGIDLSDGSISIVAKGGNGTLSYTLNDGTVQLTGSFTGLPKGTYSVTVSDGSNCNLDISNQLIIDDPTSVGLIKGGSLKIFPNPTTEKVFIEINDAEYKSLKVELKNITGQAALSQEFENAGPGFRASINLNQLPKGIYVILINDKISKEKLVIQ